MATTEKRILTSHVGSLPRNPVLADLLIRDEAGAMSRRIQELAASSMRDLRTRWPLEDMLGADLVAAALRRIEAVCAVRTGTQEGDGALWLRVDSFALENIKRRSDRLEKGTVRIENSCCCTPRASRPCATSAASATARVIWPSALTSA